MNDQEWHEIRCQADADALLHTFGGFHDGCIREAHIWTQHWVGTDLHMACSPALDTNIRLHIQRQFEDPSAIELLFEKVTRINFVPTPENYDSIIFEASLVVTDEGVFWSPDGCGPESPNKKDMTWVTSERLRWRPVDHWLGEPLRYGPDQEARPRL